MPGRSAMYSVCWPMRRHASGTRRYALTSHGAVGRRPLVVYGRKRTTVFQVSQAGERRRLLQAVMGERDLVVDEVPVRPADSVMLGWRTMTRPPGCSSVVHDPELLDDVGGARQVLQVVAHEDAVEVLAAAASWPSSRPLPWTNRTLARQGRGDVPEVGRPALPGCRPGDELAFVGADVQHRRVRRHVALEVADDLPPHRLLGRPVSRRSDGHRPLSHEAIRRPSGAVAVPVGGELIR